MPRKNLIRTSHYPYHITSRSNHRLWFDLPMPEVWKIFKDSMLKANEKHEVIIHAFVLMSNHYHLLITTPHSNIDQFMYEFNKNFSLKLRMQTNLVNRMFGGRYKWTLVTERKYYLNVVKYIYRNPVKANIVDNVEDYFYSSLRQHNDIESKIEFLRYEKDYGENIVTWFNKKPKSSYDDLLSKALSRSRFTFGRDPETQRPRKIDVYNDDA